MTTTPALPPFHPSVPSSGEPAPATQPMPPPVETARRVLTAVLESGPAIEDTLIITEALDRLLDVVPPFPPLAWEDDATELEPGVAAALAALDTAAEQATTIRELGRYTSAALLLQRIQTATVDDGWDQR